MLSSSMVNVNIYYFNKQQDNVGRAIVSYIVPILPIQQEDGISTYLHGPPSSKTT